MKNKFFKKQMKFAGYEKGMAIIMKKNIKKGFALLLIISMLLVSGIQGQAAVTKVSYRYKTYDRSKTYKGKKSTIKDIEKYKRVILKGNTTAVKKINKVLKADCNLKLKDMPYDHAMYDAETMTYDSAYYNVYTSKVTYNAKGCISIDISYEWYQGGTLSYGDEGFTFDLNSGERLLLTDVCKESNAKLTKKIKSLLIKKYGKETFFADSLKTLSAKKCNFYIKKGGKVIVTFDKYEIAPGAAGAFEIAL